jgi:hypothetical protein
MLAACINSMWFQQGLSGYFGYQLVSTLGYSDHIVKHCSSLGMVAHHDFGKAAAEVGTPRRFSHNAVACKTTCELSVTLMAGHVCDSGTLNVLH